MPTSRLVTACVLSFVALAISSESYAQRGPASGVKLITSLPWRESEVRELHDDSRGNTCELAEPGKPVEYSQFTLEVLSPDPKALPTPVMMRAALSVSFDMQRDDQRSLPTLSGGKILDYVQGHFVAVSVRVCKDLDDGLLHLHHRPIASTMKYTGSRLSQESEDLIRKSVDAFRSVGVLIKPEEKRKVDAWRTAVLLHKNSQQATSEFGRPIDLYDYVFIRGRESASGRQLNLHSFSTSEGRKFLVYLQPYRFPTRPDQGSILAWIHFTDYRLGSLIPTKSVTRKTQLRTEQKFPIADLDKLAEEKGWKSFAESVPQCLDMIIDGEWREKF